MALCNHCCTSAQHDVPAHSPPSALFDEIDHGLLVCDADGTMLFVNHAARQVLAASSLLDGRGGVLRRAQSADGGLEAAMVAASERGRRSLVRLRSGAVELQVAVLPLQGDAGGRHVLLMFGRQRACADLGLELLASSFGLTLAERGVLAALLHDATPRQIADQRGVALSTVRSQILAVRGKLGVRSIDGLLLRVAKAPPVASALRLTPTTTMPATTGPAARPIDLVAA